MSEQTFVDREIEESKKVEVHFFKESGKWYSTEYVLLLPDENFIYPRDRLLASLARHLEGGMSGIRMAGMTAVCVDSEALGYPALVRVKEC